MAHLGPEIYSWKNVYCAISYSKCQTTQCFFVIPSRAEELFSFSPEMANVSHSLISGLSLRETSKTQELRRLLLFHTPSAHIVLGSVLLCLQREQRQIVYAVPGTVEQLRPFLWHKEMSSHGVTGYATSQIQTWEVDGAWRRQKHGLYPLGERQLDSIPLWLHDSHLML